MTDGDENVEDMKAISVILAGLKPLDTETRMEVSRLVLKKLHAEE